MTTADASQIGQTGATLSASFRDASQTPRELGFLWGTSAEALTSELYAGSGSGISGSFSKVLNGLESGATYYYKAYVIVGTEYHYGAVKSFTTTSATGTGEGSDSAYARSWLGSYEIPATDVSVSTSNQMYAGRYCHSATAETYGSTNACIFNTPDSGQRIVAHTFSYSGKVRSTYTLLYDRSKHCALWTAYIAHGTAYADKGVGRHDAWAADPAIPTSWQPDLGKSYSGYSRGHQVSSSDRQTSTEENKQTFYYSNMIPQVQTLNGGTWNTLENKIQALAASTTGRDTLYVVTGPVFGSGYSTTTDRAGTVCAVPTKFFKCIMKCSFDSAGQMTAAKGAGYVFDHDGTNAPRQNVTIDYVESLTGFDFFANVPDAFETAAEKSSYSFF